MKKDIFIGILALVIGVGGIFGVYKMDQSQKFSRAQKRAEDLEFIKTELEKYKNEKGNYPITNLKVATDNQLIYRETSQSVPALPRPVDQDVILTPTLNETNFFSECTHTQYIPDVNFNLPNDPSNYCRLDKDSRYYGGGPQYGYASDGKNYKFIVLYLGEELCNLSGFEKYIDPARGCFNYNAAWSVYSEGARWW